MSKVLTLLNSLNGELLTCRHSAFSGCPISMVVFGEKFDCSTFMNVDGIIQLFDPKDTEDNDRKFFIHKNAKFNTEVAQCFEQVADRITWVG